MAEINLRSWPEISQVADGPTAAMLEHILARMARIGARLDENDRRLSMVRPPPRPEPDPPDEPPLYAAAQPRNGYQPSLPDHPPPHTVFQHQHNMDPQSWWQNPYWGWYTPYTVQQQPYYPDQPLPSYNYYQPPPQSPNTYHPPPQPSDPTYGIPSQFFSDLLPQSTPKAIPTHSVVSVPNTQGFSAGMVPKFLEPQPSCAVTTLPPGPQQPRFSTAGPELDYLWSTTALGPQPSTTSESLTLHRNPTTDYTSHQPEYLPPRTNNTMTEPYTVKRLDPASGDYKQPDHRVLYPDHCRNESGSDTDGEETGTIATHLGSLCNFDAIVDILQTPGVQERSTKLEQCKLSMSPEFVATVLSRVRNDWEAAFTFFLWSGKQPGYSHSLREYHSLISILGKFRKFDTAWSLIEDMRAASLITKMTILIMIRRHAAVHDIAKAVSAFYGLRLFNLEMGRNGIEPGRSSYIWLIHGLFLNGRVNVAHEYYVEMKEKNLLPEPKVDAMIQEWSVTKNDANGDVIMCLNRGGKIINVGVDTSPPIELSNSAVLAPKRSCTFDPGGDTSPKFLLLMVVVVTWFPP